MIGAKARVAGGDGSDAGAGGACSFASPRINFAMPFIIASAICLVSWGGLRQKD